VALEVLAKIEGESQDKLGGGDLLCNEGIE